MSSWSGGGSGWAVLVHGGAGRVPRASLDAHEAGCRDAAERAAHGLAQGLPALDAVQRAVEALESNPRYNAGTGASLDREGRLQLDAAIMEGRALRAGAVCALPPFEHPVAVARAALEDGAHVLYAAEGAAQFALRAGFTRADDETMITGAARRRLAAALGAGTAESWAGDTVGAVARDLLGNVAAATSTGGTVAKQPGRVGDSPILGGGTYADNQGGAASATGEGEAIMRLVMAGMAVHALRAGEAPERVASGAVQALEQRVGGTGGIILVGADGRLGWARNTETMSWAAGWQGGDVVSGC